MKGSGLIEAVIELSHEKGLDQDIVIEALEDAIVAAAYRKYKQYRNIEAILNRKTGEIELVYVRIVVDEVKDSYNEVLLKEAQELDPHVECGDEVEYEIKTEDFSKVIAQTSRQLLFQKIREIERESILKKYADQKGEIIHGTVGRIERNRIIVLLKNNAEAKLDKNEQIPNERFQPGDHIRVFLLDILPENKGPMFIVSRTHPRLLIKLFEAEIPEVYDGIIEVTSAAREPGRRAKVAVRTNDMDIDPVGACVGIRGARIQNIVTELCGERIDVIEWSDDLKTYISNALAPAEIIRMRIDSENREVDVEVETDQLSLAIGKQGQNVRLASKLTEYKINVNAWTPKFGLNIDTEEQPSEPAEENNIDVAESGNDSLSENNQTISSSSENTLSEPLVGTDNVIIETLSETKNDEKQEKSDIEPSVSKS